MRREHPHRVADEYRAGATAGGSVSAGGRHRWVVERTLSWLLGFRRLGVRYERRPDVLQGLLHLACALICVRFLNPVDPA